MKAATAGLTSYVCAMEWVRRGTVFQGYVMRWVLIISVFASALLNPRWVSAETVLWVS